MKLLAQGPDLNAIQKNAGLNGIPGDLGTLISNVLPFVFYASGILLLIYLVLGGFQVMLSQGDPKAVAAGQAKITNALIGFVIILLSAGIVVILGQVLHVPFFSNIF